MFHSFEHRRILSIKPHSYALSICLLLFQMWTLMIFPILSYICLDLLLMMAKGWLTEYMQFLVGLISKQPITFVVCITCLLDYQSLCKIASPYNCFIICLWLCLQTYLFGYCLWCFRFVRLYCDKQIIFLFDSF